jgi:hypothetical protein
LNRAGKGSVSVTVHGAGLGLVAFTALGRTGQTECEGTEWESETSVRCLVGHGARGTRRVAVTAGERVGSLSQATSLHAPFLPPFLAWSLALQEAAYVLMYQKVSTSLEAKIELQPAKLLDIEDQVEPDTTLQVQRDPPSPPCANAFYADPKPHTPF